MAETITVKDGQSVASLAAEYGLLPETIWNAPENSALREQRDSFYDLLDGTDQVFIPDPVPKEEKVPVEKRTTFVRRKIPEILRICFQDHSGKPRKGMKYLFTIDGEERAGEIGDDGMFEQPVYPGATSATLVLRNERQQEERYEFFLSSLDPATELCGAQQRLMNMGYDCGREYGGGGPMTEQALRAFQKAHGLEETGEPDENTLKRIAQEYGR